MVVLARLNIENNILRQLVGDADPSGQRHVYVPPICLVQVESAGHGLELHGSLTACIEVKGAQQILRCNL